MLCWNVRGINATRKWDSIKNKVTEANCDVVCFQETKKDSFDQAFIRKVLPTNFDAFLFVPSVGASGGLLVAWKSAFFDGLLKFANGSSLDVHFISRHNDSSWTLMNVYGPCTPEGKIEFTSWLKSVEIQKEEDWIILGDFNLYRYPKNRNRPGADVAEMFLFNSTISFLGLTEIPLQGRKFTWSNMQNPPLLEKLDWVFTSSSWDLSFPETSCKALALETSDHYPLVISISTNIPKAHIFRFENCWIHRPGFQDLVSQSWSTPTFLDDKARNISRKFKSLKGVLKSWSHSFSSLKLCIVNISLTIHFLENLENYRDLSLEEWNFREILREKLLSLLELQRIYWKQRGSVKWVTLGDTGTKFFHANATIKHRRNIITKLVTDEGELYSTHADKELIIWQSFRQRLGLTEFNDMLFDLPSLIQEQTNLAWLEDQFTTSEIDDVVKMLPNDKSPGPDEFSQEMLAHHQKGLL